uniref:Serine/threonine protein kinase n=1 Tax=Solibacter usitatus (strain Ellin6076) TaxID=234267 RepID=Q01ZL0_SOLUE
MPLTPGTRLGPYEILAPIGAGGMGEVYKAADTSLDREVAIKVLPHAFAQDPDRLGRFEREAKILASLNHPNIAQIFGVEGGALVMELVSGQTLSERIAEGPVPVAEALRIVAQIAEALAAAHDRGVIHRDLKPANVKLSPDGRVKVLDFGLAKSLSGGGSGADSRAETLTAAMTEAGTVLGTPGYMSPEQTRGIATDKRTDIWAVGCVLYELLTGRRTFRGGTFGDTIAAVLEREPDWDALPPSTPPRVLGLLQRCLRKDMGRRARDAGDIAIEIEQVLAEPAGSRLSGRMVSRPGSRWLRAAPFLIAAIAIAAALAGGYVQRRIGSSSAGSLTRLTALLPPAHRFATGSCTDLAVSPDGKFLAYIGLREGSRQLFFRAMDSLETTALPGTEGASDTVFFSPDGLWVGFLQGRPNVLKKISIGGGLPVTVANTQGCGGDWGADGQIRFGRLDGIFQVPAGGGAVKTLIATDLSKGERGLGAPQLLPDGKSLLLSVSTDEGTQIAVQRLATGERHILVKGDDPRVRNSAARYAAGFLFYSQADSLMAAPFNPERLELTGPPLPIARGAGQIGPQFGLSRSAGTLVYVQAEAPPPSTLVWVDRKGAEESAGPAPRDYSTPRVSPDGRKLAVAADSDIWVYDIPRGTLTRITFSGDNRSPVWTPDGKRITYVANGKISWSLLDGSAHAETLWNGAFGLPTSWAPDGKRLLFTQLGTSNHTDVSILSVEGERKVSPILQSRFRAGQAAFSPDGRRMAYTSDESARPEIYVQEFPGPGGKVQVSSQGGLDPVWGRQGRELFYRSGGKMMAVDIEAGTARVLFEARYNGGYDVSADGQRFLMVKSGGAAPPVTELNVVLNWPGDSKLSRSAR